LCAGSCKPAYFEEVCEPGNSDGCSRKGIQPKNTLGCMAELTLALICVPAATERGVNETGPNQ